jgi:hypothetical protein
VGTLKASSNDGSHWQVEFTPTAGVGASYEVNAAVLNSELNSVVKGGENAGRHLNHDFAALTLVKQRLTVNNGKLQGEFTIEKNAKISSGRLALAIWVTRAGELEPLQAAGGWLSQQDN